MDENNNVEVEKATVWITLFRRALELPGVKVDRVEFLSKNLSTYVNDSLVVRAIEVGPRRAGVEKKTVEIIAAGVIKNHRLQVSTLSFISGLPPGLGQVAAFPADLAQFFWHCVVVSQKLAYLYGWPEMIDDPADIDEETMYLLTIFVGVMFGSQVANQALKQLGIAFSVEVARRLPRKALTKYAVYRLSRQVAKWLGVRLTKKVFARILGRAIPVIGAAVAGGITWYTFKKMAAALNTHLIEAEDMRNASVPVPAVAVTADDGI